MISAYRMAIQVSHNPYTPQEVRDLLGTGKVQEAIAVLKQQGVGHLDPVEEAEQGFRDAGYCSASNIFVIPCEDDLIHTRDHPFCDREGCPCHEDRDLINILNDQVEQGLLTPQEATLITSGRAI